MSLRSLAMPYPVYVVTKVVRAGHPRLFSRAEARFLLRSTLIYYKAQHGFRVHGFCLLPDRAIVVIAPGPRASLARIMKDVWGNFARRINARWGREGRWLRPRYMVRELKSAEDVEQTLRLLHRLPLGEGCSEIASRSPLSSAGNYRRQVGDLCVDLFPPNRPIAFGEAA